MSVYLIYFLEIVIQKKFLIGIEYVPQIVVINKFDPIQSLWIYFFTYVIVDSQALNFKKSVNWNDVEYIQFQLEAVLVL